MGKRCQDMHEGITYFCLHWYPLWHGLLLLHKILYLQATQPLCMSQFHLSHFPVINTYFLLVLAQHVMSESWLDLHQHQLQCWCFLACLLLSPLDLYLSPDWCSSLWNCYNDTIGTSGLYIHSCDILNHYWDGCHSLVCELLCSCQMNVGLSSISVTVSFYCNWRI